MNRLLFVLLFAINVLFPLSVEGQGTTPGTSAGLRQCSVLEMQQGRCGICVTNAGIAYLVETTDSVDANDCSTGGGSAVTTCKCDTATATWVPYATGGGGGTAHINVSDPGSFCGVGNDADVCFETGNRTGVPARGRTFICQGAPCATKADWLAVGDFPTHITADCDDALVGAQEGDWCVEPDGGGIWQCENSFGCSVPGDWTKYANVFDPATVLNTSWGDDSQQTMEWFFRVWNQIGGGPPSEQPSIAFWHTGDFGNDVFFKGADYNIGAHSQQGGNATLQFVNDASVFWAMKSIGTVDAAHTDHFHVSLNTANDELFEFLNLGAGGIELNVNGGPFRLTDEAGNKYEIEASGLPSTNVIVRSPNGVQVHMNDAGGSGGIYEAFDGTDNRVFQITDAGWLTMGSSSKSVPVIQQFETALGPAAVWIYDGTDLDFNQPVTLSNGAFGGTLDSVVVDAATTFAVAANSVTVGCTGPETINTITGGLTGQLLVVAFTDGNCTLTDSASPTADQLALSGPFTSSADDTVMLHYNGSYWREVSRSPN